ncbi:MAG: FIST N-terminal domain-containing protein [Pseudomonadota bacterium]
MDGLTEPSVLRQQSVVSTGCIASDTTCPVTALQGQLGVSDFSLVVLFVSPDADFAAIMEKAHQVWSGAQVVGCRTAGEIAQGQGYCDGSIVALGFPSSLFQVETQIFQNIQKLDEREAIEATILARTKLARQAQALPNEFAMLLVDGLSLAEDRLVAALSSGLGPIQMFGGSSGDGVRFEDAPIAVGAQVYNDAAVLVLVRTRCEAKVFSLNNFVPTDQRMVVTKADPNRRIVQEINAEPAAIELGRLLGKAPGQIDTFTFAENPMVVRFGDTHHVRAIKRVTDNGELEFFSAIDEGLVLTIAKGSDMVEHLDASLQGLSNGSAPEMVIACDCILRRIEAGQKQQTRAVSAVLRDHNVVGFSTYGEQFGGLHVNQTMTGVALFSPKDGQTHDP